MKSVVKTIILLQILCHFGSVGQYNERAVQERSSCTSASPVCSNCRTLLDCGGDTSVSATDCGACGLVCGENTVTTPFASCYNGYDNHDITLSTNAICICKDNAGNNLQDDGYQDPYDASYYVTCVDGTPTYSACASDEIFYEITQACVSGGDCEGETGFIEDPLQCNTYLDCYNGGVRDDCPSEDLVFDEDVEDCVDPMESACSGTTPGSASPLLDVCYMYVLCNSTPELINAQCCPRGQEYIDGIGCMDGDCDLPPLCIQEYWEQLYCSNCGDEVSAYATRDICSPYYYECLDDGNGGLMPSLAECPATYPIFNPVEQYCDVATNVDECSSTTTTTTTTTTTPTPLLRAKNLSKFVLFKN